VPGPWIRPWYPSGWLAAILTLCGLYLLRLVQQHGAIGHQRPRANPLQGLPRSPLRRDGLGQVMGPGLLLDLRRDPTGLRGQGQMNKTREIYSTRSDATGGELDGLFVTLLFSARHAHRPQ
jgi:hypothetical protein